MTTPIDFAEAMRRLRERLGIPSLPVPPPDAEPPPKPRTEVDDEKREEESR
jgi:hypothetical protein